MYLINREEIPAISSVISEGKEYNLGILKDLRRHHLLKELLPTEGRFSISWTHLKKDEILEVHKHPTESMIIITEGSGQTFGDLKVPIKAGDVIFVPAGKLHGFMGGNPSGFWAISVQFEGTGLYENLNKPRVHFETDVLSSLMEKQNVYLNEYTNNPLVKLVTSRKAEIPQVKARLLSALQHWSNTFQRVLFAKAAFGNHQEFQDLSEAHIAEEIGHNKTLAQLGGNQNLWDPALASACSWFVEQMFRLSEVEKVILVHFVLEGSGQIFHNRANWLFPGNVHFNLHNEHDEEHFEMGYKVLQAQSSLHLPSLERTLDQGWVMMNYLCSIIANFSLKE